MEENLDLYEVECEISIVRTNQSNGNFYTLI